MLHIVRQLCTDYLDRGAQECSERVSLERLWGLPAVVISYVASLVGDLRKVFVIEFNLPIDLLTAPLLVISVLWSYSVVTGKFDIESSLVGVGHSVRQYRSPKVVRTLGKILLPVTVILGGLSAQTIVSRMSPIDNPIYGEVVLENPDFSYDDVSILLLSKDGQLRSQQTTKPDSEGIFIVKPVEKIYRSDHIVIKIRTCKTENKYPLSDEFLTIAQPFGENHETTHLYRFYIRC